jgi:hypothetical protein
MQQTTKSKRYYGSGVSLQEFKAQNHLELRTSGKELRVFTVKEN